MKIAVDARVLLDKQKTGIGWNAKRLLDHVLEYPDVECTLNCFLLRHPEKIKDILDEYREKGCRIKQSCWMPTKIYDLLEKYLYFPYQFVFGRNNEITQFFNYAIPYGVAGKKVTIIHDMTYKTFPETMDAHNLKWLSKNVPIYCERADVILTVSEFSRQEIHRYLDVPLEKIEVVYNGVDTEIYHNNYSDDQIKKSKEKYKIHGKYLLYLGTLEPRKNLDILIKAYFLLKNEMQEAPKLVLAGKKGWLYESIFEIVKQYSLEKDVIFTDYVDEEDVPILMAGAEVFVFPSLYEGFGIPPLEAMACGTPVVVSNAASLPEIVDNAGILVSPTKPEEIKDAIKKSLLDEALKLKLIELGLQRAKEFSWENSAEKLISIYKRLLKYD